MVKTRYVISIYFYKLSGCKTVNLNILNELKTYV